MAELRAVFEVRIVAELVTHVPVKAEMVKEIITLEHAVVGDHPVVCFRHEGFQDRSGDVRMVEAAKRVADIVQQRADNVFLVTPVAVRACGRLQRVRQPVDREAAIIAVQQLQMVKDAPGEAFVEVPGVLGNDVPVFLRAFQHFAEPGLLFDLVAVCHVVSSRLRGE